MSITSQGSANSTPESERTAAAWDGPLFDKFCRFRHITSDALGVHSVRAIAEHTGTGERRVLDVGCGFGDTTLELARQGARAMGVDVSMRFVEAARRSAEASGERRASFVCADVQQDPLGEGYDVAFSRFGTMFFSRPVAAMQNVRRALRPGGRLCMVVWRRREDNPFVHVAECIARDVVPAVEASDAPTCGPGPFSLASADLVSDVLLRAGFVAPRFERHDADVCIGCDVDEAVEFALELGPAGERLRLAGETGEQLRPVLTSALRDAFSRVARDGRVYLPSSAWIVTAERA